MRYDDLQGLDYSCTVPYLGEVAPLMEDFIERYEESLASGNLIRAADLHGSMIGICALWPPESASNYAGVV